MADPISYTKLIKTLYSKGVTVDEIVKQLGVSRDAVNQAVGTQSQTDPKPPTTRLPSSQPSPQPTSQDETESSRPGLIRRMGKAGVAATREAAARHSDRHGIIGQKIADKIRGKRGRSQGSPTSDPDRKMAAAIDHATQMLSTSISELGDRIEKVLSKVDYGVRESTSNIVNELNRISKTMNQDSYKDLEDDAESGGNTPDDQGTADSKSSGGGGMLGKLAAAGIGAGAATMAATEPAAGAIPDATSADDLKNKEQNTKDQAGGDVEMKADKMTFVADEVSFSDSFGRALAGSFASGGGGSGGSPGTGGGAVSGGGGGPAGNGGPTAGAAGDAYKGPAAKGDRLGRGGGKSTENYSGGKTWSLKKPMNSKTDLGDSSKDDLMKGTYDAFRRAGLSHEGAIAMSGEVGRENGFNSKLVFGSHTDPKNGAKNSGFFSWQGARNGALMDFMKSKGLIDGDGKIVKSQASLDAMAQFSMQEMEKGSKAGGLKPNKELADYLKQGGIDSDKASDMIGRKYVKWAIDNPKYHDSGVRNRTYYKNKTAALTRDSDVQATPDPTPAAPALSDDAFDKRFSGKSPAPQAQAQVQPLSDDAFNGRFGSGAGIDAMSTDNKAAASAPMVVQAPKPLSDDAFNKRAPPPRTTKDDEPDDKDKEPPDTAKEDHFKDFPGIGRSRHSGLGM